MIVKLEENMNQKEIEVLIKYAEKNSMVNRLEAVVRSVGKTVECKLEGRAYRVSASEIYYVESVDKRTFVYCETQVYRTDLRLYQLMEMLEEAGFVQISKSSMLNLNMLESIRPLFNSRMEAALSNGEKINVTRKYIPSIKAKLLER